MLKKYCGDITIWIYPLPPMSPLVTILGYPTPPVTTFFERPLIYSKLTKMLLFQQLCIYLSIIA